VLQDFLLTFAAQVFSSESGLMGQLEGGLSWFLRSPSDPILKTFPFMGLLMGIAISNCGVVPIRFPPFS
jgi:hypothetical protein